MTNPILSPNNEKLMQDFQAALAGVNTPGDMFPPDGYEAGVREPRNPILPSLIGCECLQLAKVFDMNAARQKLLGKSARLLTEIDTLITA